ncbi:Arc family DNA-binding protein [Pantoea sp. PNA 03-3]|uniref:Arc family DNA-binding protein n=1 Tax=Pantoea sp. PNA 03-3 TaxID=2135460 RepID=UPI000D7629BD|nr:Arc family DNA-binding protein [Pantoea sp. PNA 03-3]PXV70931.1 Arc-like DNA binding dprotein [Pantoea sp. PNA 03-3]
MSERRYRHPQVNLRLPEELKEKLYALAGRHHRSANTEMVAAITAWIERHEEGLADEPPATAEERISALEERVAMLEGRD